MARTRREQSGDTPTDRPELTLSDAATATGKSRPTIRRRLDEGAFPNARRLDGRNGKPGPWVIPVTDLLAAGLQLHAPGAADQAPVVDVDVFEQLRAELAGERERRIRAEGERDRWQAVAEERDRTVKIAEHAMRALPPAGATSEPRRTWWGGKAKP